MKLFLKNAEKSYEFDVASFKYYDVLDALVKEGFDKKPFEAEITFVHEGKEYAFADNKYQLNEALGLTDILTGIINRDDRPNEGVEDLADTILRKEITINNYGWTFDALSMMFSE